MIRAPRVVRRVARRSIAVRRNHYAPDTAHPAHSSDTHLHAFLLGDPIAWKRTAWVNLRGRMARSYDSQRIEKGSFALAITAALDALHKEVFAFGTQKVTVFLTFNFTGTTVRRDVDNLIKFILDALTQANIIADDVQVMEVVGKKVLGANYNSTEIYVEKHPHVIELLDDDVIELLDDDE